jgi:hypothetical protein
MKKNKTQIGFKTAPAAFQWDRDRNWSRVLFLSKIAECTPEVLEDLRNRVLPVYRPLHPRSKRGILNLRSDYALQDQIMGQIGADVACWAERFNLRGRISSTSGSQAEGLSLFEWMTGIIVCTLLEWQADPTRLLTWCDLPKFSVRAHMEYPNQVRIKVDGWPLERQTEAAFKKHVRDQFESQVQEYVEKRKGEAEGLLHLRSRRASNHFAFLALFQCLRWSHTQIHRQCKCSRSAVSEGIKDAAESVIGPTYEDWPMPPRPPGRRPRGDANPR